MSVIAAFVLGVVLGEVIALVVFLRADLLSDIDEMTGD